MDAKRLGAYARLLAIIGNKVVSNFQTDLLWDISRLSRMSDEEEGRGFKILLRSGGSEFVDADDISRGDLEMYREYCEYEMSFFGNSAVTIRPYRAITDEYKWRYLKTYVADMVRMSKDDTLFEVLFIDEPILSE